MTLTERFKNEEMLRQKAAQMDALEREYVTNKIAEEKANAMTKAQVAKYLNSMPTPGSMNFGDVGLSAMMMEKARMQGGYMPMEGESDREANERVQRQAIADRMYDRDNRVMREAEIVDGRAPAEYWDAAQRASEYEQRGLADMYR